jgi:hypothetical protein
MRMLITREIQYYNLDIIISIVCRVNSIRGNQFRIWANKILKDFDKKCYAFSRIFLNENDLISKNNFI